MSLQKIKRKVRSALKVLKKEGPLGVLIVGLQKIHNYNKNHSPEISLRLMVRHADVLAADPRHPKVSAHTRQRTVQPKINWVMSPPGKGSGGHQNLFRFISYLEKAGYRCRIYLYSTNDKRSISEILKDITQSYDHINAEMLWLDEDNKMEDADAVFATGWETTYPVYNSSLKAKRFYFVQDYEPYFFPIGTNHTLAENSYRFGFYGVTAGGWLAKKLSDDFGMQTDYFDFAANKELYKFTNNQKRKEVFFYARPATPRRGFELGIAALEIFHNKHPEYTINLAGADVSHYKIPFPYNNLKTLELSQLGDVYNRCSCALVLSLTNMSLLPLELLSCGTIPVVNDGENNRLVSNNPFIAYADPSPLALAEKLSEIVNMPKPTTYAKKAAASVPSAGWDEPGNKFVQIMDRELGRV